MNRPIKFRGLATTEQGSPCPPKWVYGNLIVADNGDTLMAVWEYASSYGYFTKTWGVKPETVGQLVYIQDKNGKPIYEGDIIRTIIAGDIYHDVAKWSDANAGWIFESTQGADSVQWSDLEDGKPEVIGNIYESKSEV